MRSVAALAVSIVLLVPHVASSAVCPDRTPAAIAAPGALSLKCQQTMGKAALGFAKAKIKAMAKCASKQVPGACPSIKETDKITKAAIKAAAKITTDCGADAVQGGLTSSYAGLTDDTVMSSCLLSQHSATADVIVGDIAGTPGQVRTGEARDKCVKTLNKTGVKQATGAHKIINKCLSNQMKLGTPGDLAPVCIGRYVGGFIPPTDVKAAEGLSKLTTKSEAAVAKDCTAVTPTLIKSIFACSGATTVADLQTCIVCRTWDGVLDLVEHENSENGSYVANGPGALQTAVNGAAVGAKLLIAPGDYEEMVSITTNGLQLVGCGGATGTRPRIVRPISAPPDTAPNGISAGSVDGLHFQTLDFYNWDDNGIFVAGAEGVSFRDIFADGNLNSEYGVFPILSNNVLIETSNVVNVADAGIYVGQSTNIVVRYSRATDNVAGLEIENSSTASVHNNYLSDNTGGLLVFKLPGLPVQLSDNHQVFANVSINNNTPNFAIPGSTVSNVPTGTGILIISNNDSDFYSNIVQGNDSFGIALVDQQAVNFLVGDPPPFDPTSHTCAGGTNDGALCSDDSQCPGGTCEEDQKATNNKIHDNLVGGNGGAPASPVGGNVLMAIFESDLPHGNCMSANGIPPEFVVGANDCP